MGRGEGYTRNVWIREKCISFGTLKSYRFWTPGELTYKTIGAVKQAIEERKPINYFDKWTKEEFTLDYEKVEWVKTS